jgi:hypothetical protein
MKLIKKLANLFTGPPKDSSFWVSVKCGRCGEVIQTRIDLNNDLSAEYGEGEGETAYYCRKVLIGKKGCYLPVEIELRFDAGRNLIDKQIKGGKFVDA